MKTFTQQEILDRYERLPAEVKDAIFAEATAEKMETIGRKHGLLLDAIGKVATITGYVMVGLVHPKDFSAELASELGVSAVKAREIAEDINEQVFKPIREHMIKIHDISDETAAPPTQPPPPISFAQKPALPKTPRVAPMIFPEKLVPEIIKQPPQEIPARPAGGPKPNIQTPIPPAPQFIDSLGELKKPAAPPFQPAVQPPAPTPTVPPTIDVNLDFKNEVKPPGPDPYREPVE